MTDETEKHGQLIRYLEDALALADEIEDGNTAYLIKNALREAGSRQFKPVVTPPRIGKMQFAIKVEKHGQLIRYLEDALALADDNTAYLIRSALYQARQFKPLEFKHLGPPPRIAKMQFAIWLAVAAAIGATMPRMLGPMLAPPITNQNSGTVPDSSAAKEAAESVAEKLRALPVKYNRPGHFASW
jgi:hypothetical protein